LTKSIKEQNAQRIDAYEVKATELANVTAKHEKVLSDENRKATIDDYTVVFNDVAKEITNANNELNEYNEQIK